MTLKKVGRVLSFVNKLLLEHLRLRFNIILPLNLEAKTGAGLGAKKIFFAYFEKTHPSSPGKTI